MSPPFRILYADLEFLPEERFSLAARLLLQGMIKRDPSTRMGAWENPPQDIMSAPFFGGIQWDAIYERRFDGPYVPEAQAFGGKSKKANGSPVPGSGESSDKDGDKSGGQDSQGNERPRSGKESPRGEGGVNGGESEQDESEEEEEEDSCSELKGMRDSVFIRPHDAAGNNLLDWSFIDEKVLAETCAEGDVEKKKKKKKKKSKRVIAVESDATSPSAAAEVDGAAQSVNIIEKIETKQVAFSASGGAAQEATAAGPVSEGQEN